MSGDAIPPSVAKMVLCRYNADGVCMYGEACFFSHDRATSKFHNVCNYFFRGFCRYGEKCRFDHVKASRLQVDSKTTSVTETGSTPCNQNSEPSTHHLNSMEHINRPIDRISEHLATTRLSTNAATLLDYDSNTNCISSPTGSKGPRVLDTSWAEAPVFVPTNPYVSPTDSNTHTQANSFGSYSDVARTHLVDPESVTGFSLVYPLQDYSYQACSSFSLPPTQLNEIYGNQINPQAMQIPEVCPMYVIGACQLGDLCSFPHLDQCPICAAYCLEPNDKEQRSKHEMECFMAAREDIEISLKQSENRKKVCGICMDVVLDKERIGERMFGILSDCTHVFCLKCLREWRCQKNFEKEVKRSCPECRVVSHLVIPSKMWVDEKEEKDKLLETYKATLSTKDCKYFDKGNGTCPFGVHCFYKHANSKGELVPKVNPRVQISSSGERRFMGANRVLDALGERESRTGGDLIRGLLDMNPEDFFVAAAIFGWDVDSEYDDESDSSDSRSLVDMFDSVTDDSFSSP